MMGSNIKIEPPKPNPEAANNNPDVSNSNQVSNISSTQTSSLSNSSPSLPASKTISPPSERLKDLNNLFKQGLINKDDFESKKAEILKAM
jgi:hypothetical protein